MFAWDTANNLNKCKFNKRITPATGENVQFNVQIMMTEFKTAKFFCNFRWLVFFLVKIVNFDDIGAEFWIFLGLAVSSFLHSPPPQ